MKSVAVLEITSLPNSEDEDTAVIGMDSSIRAIGKGPEHHSKGMLDDALLCVVLTLRFVMLLLLYYIN